MSKKAQSRKYEFDLLFLPPLKLVLGDIPVPDPRRQPSAKNRRPSTALPNKQEIVERIIKRLSAK